LGCRDEDSSIVLSRQLELCGKAFTALGDKALDQACFPFLEQVGDGLSRQYFTGNDLPDDKRAFPVLLSPVGAAVALLSLDDVSSASGALADRWDRRGSVRAGFRRRGRGIPFPGGGGGKDEPSAPFGFPAVFPVQALELQACGEFLSVSGSERQWLARFPIDELSNQFFMDFLPPISFQMTNRHPPSVGRQFLHP
jgi:hypothetical protein